MKNNVFSILLFALVLTFSGCEKDDLAYSKKCNECIQITGRITTTNGTAPIPNQNMTVYWNNDAINLLHSFTRKKATGRTDKNGYYDLKFNVRDSELREGSFTLVAEDIDTKIYYESPGLAYFNSNKMKRDTTLHVNYTIPKKAFIEMQTTNAKEIKPNDYFACTYTFLGGVDGKQEMNIVGPLSFPNTIEVAAEQPVILKFSTTKDGILSDRNDTLTLKPLEIYKYTVTF